MHAVQIPVGSNFLSESLPGVRALIVRDADLDAPPIDLESSSPATHHTAITLIIHENQNGIEQITELMRQHPAIAHLNLVVAVGKNGLLLGRMCLNSETLERYAWDLQEWFAGLASSAHSDRPRIYIYVAGVRDIKQLNSITRTLEQLTGADVRIFNV